MKRNRFAIPDLQLKSLGIAIQQRRLELGISQEDLAEQAGLHRTYVSLIERKSCNMSMMKLLCIAQVLELTPSELLEMAASLGTIKKRA